MKVKVIVSSLFALGVLSQCPLAFGAAKDLNSATTPADADFPKVGGNLGNQNYSSLTQINKHNLNKLGAVWRTQISLAPTTQPAPAPGDNNTGQQTSALVVDGVIYIDTPVGGVAAIDGKTGAVKWKWTPTTANSGFNPSGTRRGVSVGDGKVYTLAGGNRVVALNKDTGAVVWAVQPTGPGGAALGNIAKVGTVYSDNMVYVGTNDGNRGAGFAVRSSDGGIVWSFYGAAAPGTLGGDTWGPLQPNGQSCAITAGVTPWIHPSVDPELNTVYWSFGNVRSCGSSQDGQQRPGDNLFGNSLVAVDAKTGAYKWHYQIIRHDITDMDNVSPTVLADVEVGGQTKKAIYYGSKSSMTFILDRTNGQPITPVVERPMARDTRQHSPATQKFPAIGSWQTRCIVYQKLGTDDIPGSPWRAVPNYNGFQPDAQGNLVYTEPNYLDVDKPFIVYEPGYEGGATHRMGCLYDPHFDFPLLATTTQNGGNDFSGQAFVQHRDLYVIPWAYANVAHYRSAGSNGQRAPGQYMGGGILALDAKTGQVLWDTAGDGGRKSWLGLDMAHGQSTLATASDLVFAGRDDGYIIALDVLTGEILWKFQSGAGVEGGMATYSIDGEQYVVALSFVGGDYVTAFKLGGTMGELPSPVVSAGAIRQSGGGTPTPGSTVNNTVLLGRNPGPQNSFPPDTAAGRDSIAANGTIPTNGHYPVNLGVPVGTTVTFLNPGAATFPNFPNLKEHCATQFFEGLFNPRLQPGQTFLYTFDREGEYWYNDCTDPRPTGRINVKAEVIDLPGALHIAPAVMNLKAPTGIFTGVNGNINAVLTLPDGYTLDTGYGAKVTIKTPLSDVLFEAVKVHTSDDGKTVTATFDRAELDNNIDAGNAVPLTVSGLFMHNGVQKRLTSTANVKVTK
jgi:outer membrane protein assembly factor BamB